MPAANYSVDLPPEEREHLLRLRRRGQPAARKGTRARMLLKADAGLTEAAIATALDGGRATVGRVRQRFVEEGLASALTERPRPGQRRQLTGKPEAPVLARACSDAPDGRARWTVRRLADKVVDLGWVSSLSHETVRQTLQNTRSRPGRSTRGAFRK